VTALEAMLELRRQFAQLLQEAHLLPPSNSSKSGRSSGSSGSKPGSSAGGKWSSWADDPLHPANRWASVSQQIKQLWSSCAKLLLCRPLRSYVWLGFRWFGATSCCVRWPHAQLSRAERSGAELSLHPHFSVVCFVFSGFPGSPR